MFPWIWRRTKLAFFVGSLFMLLIICGYYIREQTSGNEQSEMKLKGIAKSLYRYQLTLHKLIQAEVEPKSNRPTQKITDYKALSPTDMHSQTPVKGSQTVDEVNQTPDKGSQTIDKGSQTSNKDSQTPVKGSQTLDKDSQTPDKGSQTIDKDSQTPDKGSQTLGKGSQTIDKDSQTPDKGSQTQDKGSQTQNKGSQTQNKGSQTLDKGSQTQNKGSQTQNKGSQTLDKGSQTQNKGSQRLDRDSQIPVKDSRPPLVITKDKVHNHHPSKNNVFMPPILKVDRFSAQPIDSSLAMPLIKGTEHFDLSVRWKYLGCRANISRDTNVAYGKCRNFTNMHFIDGSRVVAMPSFPGSGSTWARTALEQATGIYTGSVYCDKGLKSKGFAGEMVVSANVLTVKTHLPSRELFPTVYRFRDRKKYKDITAVILLVRNPLDSFISKWNFLQTKGSHVAIVEPNNFGNFSEWRKFVNESAVEFKQLLHFWLEQANIPSILVIKYEDMLTDLATQLRKMLDFLQVPYTDKDIDCVANDKLEHYHRKKVKSFEHYIPADRQLVLHSLMSVERLLNKYHVSYKDVLNDYQNYNIT